MNHICFPGRVGPATIFIRTPISKRSTLGRILHHRSRNACARAAIRALKLCLTCLLRTFTWNYIAERVPFKGAFAYVARVALAKSKQRFAGHVNVAPFRATQIRDLAFATSGKNLKLLHRINRKIRFVFRGGTFISDNFLFHRDLEDFC